MNEEQQIALALELSRKEAEGRSARKVPGFRDEPTDEELVQALDLCEAEKENRGHRKTSGKSVIVDSDSDDELPPGLSEDTEDAQLKEALELSKKSLEEELERKERCWLDSGSISRPVADVGLLGGAKIGAFKDVSKAERTHQEEQLRVDGGEVSERTWNCAGTVEVAESHEKDFASRIGRGLLGGAKNQGPGRSDPGDSTSSDEPMDIEELTDQPLAFSNLGGETGDTAQPIMRDLESELTHQIRDSKAKEHSSSATCQSSRDVHEESSRTLNKDDDVELAQNDSEDIFKEVFQSNKSSHHPGGKDDPELSKPRDEDGDGEGRSGTLSYEEIKAKEEEDIRRATELSMKGEKVFNVLVSGM